jgi:methionyl-tRNA synthetase
LLCFVQPTTPLQFIVADALARYHRVFGYDSYFLTGSDEHGQKVAASAEKSGRSPIEHCDIYVDGYKKLNDKLGISNTSYIRTTDAYHEYSAKV